MPPSEVESTRGARYPATLEARAAMAGMSLSEYLFTEINETAERHKRKPISAHIDTAHLVREEREARGSCSMRPSRSSDFFRFPRD